MLAEEQATKCEGKIRIALKFEPRKSNIKFRFRRVHGNDGRGKQESEQTALRRIMHGTA